MFAVMAASVVLWCRTIPKSPSLSRLFSQTKTFIGRQIPMEHLSAVELREHLQDASDLSADDASRPTPSPSETGTREDRR